MECLMNSHLMWARVGRVAHQLGHDIDWYLNNIVY